MHVSVSVLYIYTEPETLVNDELRPPVIKIQPSFKPIATEYDCNTKFLGTYKIFIKNKKYLFFRPSILIEIIDQYQILVI